MSLAIWIIVIVVCVLGLIFSLLTSVTKWGDKMVDKYVPEDDKEIKNKDVNKIDDKQAGDR